ncbi:hypothetical protein AGRA3207_007063 [Actinomadura graeca]|uniref:ATP-binding protein n=1 Tax=Actinomadura graeca TaxID=2750812 RepID=A0ABX8R6G3_9ACTN|nr:hypothetical protein [Actinomadura graeca]QXJ25552.1 hypothetical protein AGRA3207_007063 [Actinomadura graeca]
MNPFPGLEPLCPWESPEHTDHYAEVDHSKPAFEEFQKALADGSRVVRHGLVVLTTGGSGCGKTSLMHRCAAWVKGAPPPGHAAQIVDLTREGRSGWDSERRVRHLFERLADELESLFDDDAMRMLDERRGDPDRVAPALSKALRAASEIAVVLLPPSEVPDEVVRIAGLTGKSMLLLAETSVEQVAAACAHTLGPACATPVPQLRVGELAAEDGWRYVSHHFARHRHRHGGGAWRDVTEDTMRTLVEKRGRMSVKELQMLLHGKYQEIADSGQANGPDLTFEDFSEYYFRTARGI